jgi:hypothetical protein
MQRDASLHRPFGLIRSKAVVLGAAYGRKPTISARGFIVPTLRVGTQHLTLSVIQP